MKMNFESAGPVVGLSSVEVEQLRTLLLNRKAELLDSFSALEAEALAKGKAAGELSEVPDNPADLGTDRFEQSLSLALMENESGALREVEEALRRIEEGTYGACAECGGPIGKARLRALPQATLCWVCKRLEESSRGQG